MTRQERIAALQAQLAERGILALYGGCKGHGFWLYPATPEALARWTATRGFTSYEGCGPCIQNDGVKSGNPYFTMFDDAERLLTKEVSVESLLPRGWELYAGIKN